jgi:hypothetical protein
MTYEQMTEEEKKEAARQYEEWADKKLRTSWWQPFTAAEWVNFGHYVAPAANEPKN